MADVPQNLLQQIKDFEEIFTVDRAKLKQVVDHFVKELEKGLSVEGGNIVSLTASVRRSLYADH
jgi:hexokinase